MAKKVGEQTYILDKKISISEAYSIAGPCEAMGPISKYFDKLLEDDLMGMKSYEQAESAMTELGISELIKKSNLIKENVDVVLGGDLINQIVPTSFALKNLMIPYWGLYNACATFAEAIQIACLGIESGAFKNTVVTSSSHYSSSERQYRTPLELGSQAPIYSQRTVTAMGCILLNENINSPYISSFTIGRALDFSVNDPFDMGTAMAPAAADTIIRHFKDTETTFEDYDAVITGDLAKSGYEILKDILKMKGYTQLNKLNDCGLIIYDRENQNVNNGGSGAGCCSSVFASYLYSQLKNKKINKLLFVPTGALLSSTTYQQKLNIPSIAHALVISNQ